MDTSRHVAAAKRAKRPAASPATSQGCIHTQIIAPDTFFLAQKPLQKIDPSVPPKHQSLSY